MTIIISPTPASMGFTTECVCLSMNLHAPGWLNDPLLFEALLAGLATLGCGLSIWLHGASWKSTGLFALSLFFLVVTLALRATGIL